LVALGIIHFSPPVSGAVRVSDSPPSSPRKGLALNRRAMNKKFTVCFFPGLSAVCAIRPFNCFCPNPPTKGVRRLQGSFLGGVVPPFPSRLYLYVFFQLEFVWCHKGLTLPIPLLPLVRVCKVLVPLLFPLTPPQFIPLFSTTENAACLQS